MNFKIDPIEKRVIKTEEKIEFRAGDGEESAGVVSGYGIVYNKETEIFPGFREVIKPGAFSESLKNAREVKSFFNHDTNQVLSTTKSEPALELVENARGVKFYSPIPPTTYGNDLKVNLERGNVRGASFAFSINEGGDIWREDKKGVVTREVTSATLYEIGPVTNPAYDKSTASLRSLEQCVEEWRKENGDKIAEEQRKEIELNNNKLQLKLKNVSVLEKL